ncbi:purine-nucleoside phosphorylase [Salibacteraceae bacterium]|nr:purine-nucleoside phosphorylase [Salibacteraceae bacterium]
MEEYKKLEQAVYFLKNQGIKSPEIGIVLGTGLGKLTDLIEIEKTIDYREIPNFPLSTVEFHSGKLIYGTLGDKKVLAMQGRFHMYEGYSASEVVFPIRVLKMLGVKFMVLTNAAGGINLSYEKGQLILIDDHINLLPDNPLIGRNIDKLGVRFPDMSAPYSNSGNELLMAVAEAFDYNLQNGVYAAVIGPNLETRAEYRFLKTIGVDLVGMSTVPEVIAANHMNLPCVAISIVTDLCDPDNLEEANIGDIIANAGIGEKILIKLIPSFLQKLKV